MKSEDMSKKDLTLYLIVIVIAIGIISTVVLINITMNRESFTDFYMYDENGGYNFPQEIQVNHNYNLTVAISNFEQNVMLYRVYIKVGNLSTIINKTHPSDFYMNSTYFETTILNGFTRSFIVSMNMTLIQNNTRLIAELWKYSIIYYDYIYSGQFLFKDYNVTV